MKKLFLLLALTPTFLIAEVPISTLPQYTGSQVSSTDTVPFVHFGSPNVTGQLPISQLYSVPSLQSPNLSGTLTIPTVNFQNATGTATLTTVTGTITGIATLGSTPVQHNLNTVSAPYTNCGSLAGATGCVQMKINGTVHYVPYF